MQVMGQFKPIIIELAHIPIKDKKLNKTLVGAQGLSKVFVAWKMYVISFVSH